MRSICSCGRPGCVDHIGGKERSKQLANADYRLKKRKKLIELRIQENSCPCGKKGCACKGKYNCRCNPNNTRAPSAKILVKNYDGSNCTPKTLRKITRSNKILYRKYYLQSPYWAKIKKAVADACGNKCQLCPYVGILDVHHLTYIRLGEELPEDLLGVCRSCHNKLEIEKKYN